MSELIAVSCHCFHSKTAQQDTHTNTHTCVVLSSVESNWRDVFQHLENLTSPAYLQWLLPIHPLHFNAYYVSSRDEVFKEKI